MALGDQRDNLNWRGTTGMGANLHKIGPPSSSTSNGNAIGTDESDRPFYWTERGSANSISSGFINLTTGNKITTGPGTVGSNGAENLCYRYRYQWIRIGGVVQVSGALYLGVGYTTQANVGKAYTGLDTGGPLWLSNSNLDYCTSGYNGSAENTSGWFTLGNMPLPELSNTAGNQVDGKTAGTIYGTRRQQNSEVNPPYFTGGSQRICINGTVVARGGGQDEDDDFEVRVYRSDGTPSEIDSGGSCYVQGPYDTMAGTIVNTSVSGDSSIEGSCRFGLRVKGLHVATGNSAVGPTWGDGGGGNNSVWSPSNCVTGGIVQRSARFILFPEYHFTFSYVIAGQPFLEIRNGQSGPLQNP